MIAIVLADGFEEIEALTPLDVLRRAGLDVKTVAIDNRIVSGTHGIHVTCDLLASEIDYKDIHAVIFPGGMPGATNLDTSPVTDKIIDAVLDNRGHFAAICAAPLILGKRNLLSGRAAVCYPGFEKFLKGAILSKRNVVTDGNVTTAIAMGSALDFSLELVKVLSGEEARETVINAITPQNPRLKSKGADTTPADKDDEAFSKCSDYNPDYSNYKFPPVDLLKKSSDENSAEAEKEIKEKKKKLASTLDFFGAKSTVTSVERGPRLTRYNIVPQKGVRASTIINAADDISLYFGVDGIRIEAPVPGRSTIGIEIPNQTFDTVRLRDLIETEDFKNSQAKTFCGIGKDVLGTPVFAEIEKLPHLLIAGATGMGKSVSVNSMVVSMLYRARPDEIKFIFIDPKMVEFSIYNGIPHLLCPVITDVNKSIGALSWAVNEMERRYELMARLEVRKVDSYNEAISKDPTLGIKLPKIIIVIDELNDLMIANRKKVEALVATIAQKARASGIHMIIGTQRPYVNVLSGMIKANIPSRLSFRVCSFSDSKTILDCSGAEKLLNNGDMLYFPVGKPYPKRVQGAYVSDKEIEEIVEFIKTNAGAPVYDKNVLNYLNDTANSNLENSKNDDCTDEDEFDDQISQYMKDTQFKQAVEIALESKKVSTALLQRKLTIGYSKSAKFIDVMENLGIIGESNRGSHDVLITGDEWLELKGKYSINKDSRKQNEKDDDLDVLRKILESGKFEIEPENIEDYEETEDGESNIYDDDFFVDAIDLAVKNQKISTSLLQRKLSIGYRKAAYYIDLMEEMGIISESNGTKPRETLITLDEWKKMKSKVDVDDD